MPDKMSLQKTLEQGRAKFAYQSAEDGSKIAKRKEYKSYVKKIPMLIKTNGLGAALSLLKPKALLIKIKQDMHII